MPPDMSDTIEVQGTITAIRDGIQIFVFIIITAAAIVDTLSVLILSAIVAMAALALRYRLNPHWVTVTKKPEQDLDYLLVVSFGVPLLPNDREYTLKLGKKTRLNRLKEILF